MSLTIEYIPVASLTANPRNSRTHDPDQVLMLADSIRRFGFNNPVLIDEDNVLIAGHGRLAGAKLAGLAEVPCVRLAHLTDEEKRAYLIADNRIAEKSGWDEDLLRSELDELLDLGFDESLLGFTDADLDALVGDYTGSPEDGPLDDNAASKPGAEVGQAGAESSGEGAKSREKTIFPVLIYFSRAGFDAWNKHLKATNESDGAAAVLKLMGHAHPTIDPDKEKRANGILKQNGVV